MTSRNPIIDSEIFDLIARLRHLQDETELLTAQQRELQRQLQIMENTARELHAKNLDDTSGVRAEEWRLERAPVHDTVDEASEESFPCSDAPAWSLPGRP